MDWQLRLAAANFDVLVWNANVNILKRGSAIDRDKLRTNSLTYKLAADDVFNGAELVRALEAADKVAIELIRLGFSARVEAARIIIAALELLHAPQVQPTDISKAKELNEQLWEHYRLALFA